MDTRGFYRIEITKLSMPPSQGVGRNEYGQAEAFRDEGQDGRLRITLDVTCLREADQVETIRALETAIKEAGFMSEQ